MRRPSLGMSLQMCDALSPRFLGSWWAAWRPANTTSVLPSVSHVLVLRARDIAFRDRRVIPSPPKNLPSYGIFFVYRQRFLHSCRHASCSRLMGLFACAGSTYSLSDLRATENSATAIRTSPYTSAPNVVSVQKSAAGVAPKTNSIHGAFSNGHRDSSTSTRTETLKFSEQAPYTDEEQWSCSRL